MDDEDDQKLFKYSILDSKMSVVQTVVANKVYVSATLVDFCDSDGATLLMYHLPSGYFITVDPMCSDEDSLAINVLENIGVQEKPKVI